MTSIASDGQTMNPTEAQHRDGVLRAFFQGKTWDNNAEFQLKRELVRQSHLLLPNYPWLIDDEWEVNPGHPNDGRGDLLFTDGIDRFAVVEVKFIDARSGGTARAKRTHNRSSVREQALKYAAALRQKYPEATVVAYAYTNESPTPLEIASWSGASWPETSTQ